MFECSKESPIEAVLMNNHSIYMFCIRNRQSYFSARTLNYRPGALRPSQQFFTNVGTFSRLN